MNNKYNKQKGFTLMELMIVVAILGIIASFALPSYFQQIQRSKRSDAKVELLRISQLQESFFVQNLSYAKDLKQLKFASVKMPTAKGLYEIQVTARTPAGCDINAGTPKPCLTYQLTATPMAGETQVSDADCVSFRVDNVSRQWAIGAAGHGASTYPAPGVAPTVEQKDKAKQCWNK